MENFENTSSAYVRTRIAERLREAREPRLPQRRRRHGLGRRYRD